MIKLWAFEFWNMFDGIDSDYEDPVAVQKAFKFNLQRMTQLEKIGLEGVFFSEHHFLNALSPCPNLLIAATAQHTSRMRLGVLGNVPGFHQPFRLAEELAMLDYLTDGRLEIGYAVGIPPEFMFLGIQPGDIRPMYAESIDILERARQGRYVSFQGKYYNYDNVPSMPRPRPTNHRREWVAAYSAASAINTAKRNAKLALGFQSTADIASIFATYRDAMAAEGHPATPDDMAIRRQVLVWDTDSEAAALSAELVEKSGKIQAKVYEPMYKMAAKTGGTIALPAATVAGVKDAQVLLRTEKEGGKKPTTVADLISAEHEFIHGSPRTAAERIIEQCRETGAGHIISYNLQGMSEAHVSHHERLWSQVLPILQSADVLRKTA